MTPLFLMRLLEDTDLKFKDWFYPRELRCPIDRRVVETIERHFPVYLPTRPEYRDWKKRLKRKNCVDRGMMITIPEDELLYRPNPQTRVALQSWKTKVRGTLAVLRIYNADSSWGRFFELLEDHRTGFISS